MYNIIMYDLRICDYPQIKYQYLKGTNNYYYHFDKFSIYNCIMIAVGK